MQVAPLQRQTTVLFGGSNGTKTLIATLGDKSNPANVNHTLRIVTRNPSTFLNSPPSSSASTSSSSQSTHQQQELITWRCHEQKHFSNVFPAAFIPSTWMTHVGKPDSVFGYDDADLEAAISGISRSDMATNGSSSSSLATVDDGGVADVLILACPVTAHLEILRSIARTLYKLDAEHKLLGKSAPPLLIGTLYAAGGFDWMCRLAFCMEKPKGFLKWNRELGLFGLRSFPYLCKSLKKGEVSLFGRFPQLGVVVSPSTEYMREEVARRVMNRVLRGESNRIKMEFMGLEERNVNLGDVTDNVNGMAKGAAAASVMAAQIGRGADKGKSSPTSHSTNPAAVAGGGGGFVGVAGPPDSMTSGDSTSGTIYGHTSPPEELEITISAFHNIRSIADAADPHAALGFLSCTLNATNQILHPCILYALFNTPTGEIRWPEKEHLTPFPRFYADGANKKAGEAITSIALGEFFPLMSILDTILAPSGMQPICSQHGGEPVARFGLSKIGNHPNDIAERSGLMNKVMYGVTKQRERGGKAPDIINYRQALNWLMHMGLSNNSRLGFVLAPSVRDKENTDMIRPIVTSRFFVDDVPHGLCVALGLGEMLGFDLEKDMMMTLKVVRRLQGWMGKEYVLPEGASYRKKGIVGGARDLKETSAPQAFGVWTVDDLRRFLSLSPFGDETSKQVDLRVRGSALMKNKIAFAKL